MDYSQIYAGGILWRAAQDKYSDFEQVHPLSFGWRHENKTLRPRFRKGADGYWYNPSDNDSGKAQLSCTGDLMCEPRQQRAYQFGDSYFFHPGFRYVREVLRASDLTMGNLETTLTDCTPYAGERHRVGGKYHCNAPASYLEAIRYAGFDVLVNANNHDCDSGVEGLIDTLDALDRYQFMHTGTFHPQNDERLLLIRVNGIRLAILSYATYYNKMDANFTETGRNRLLNMYSPEKAAADMELARNNGAEFILVYIHWGKEYTHEPNDSQRQYAAELAEAGADYIVGSHSHCLQGRETVTTADGRTVPVLYSMGNFITNEKKEISKHTGILQIVLQKQPEGVTVREEYFIPCYVFKQIGTSSFAPVPADFVLNGGLYHETLAEARRYIEGVMCRQMPLLQTSAFSVQTLCDILGKEPISPAASKQYCTGLCTAVDKVREGCVYFDVEHNEEHVLQAWQNGAAAVVTEQPGSFSACIQVPEIQAACGQVCAALRQRFSAGQVLVAGFCGREKVLRLAEAVLSSTFTVTPLTEQEADVVDFSALRPYHEVCLQEWKQESHMQAAVFSQAIAPAACVITGFVPAAQTQEELLSWLTALTAGLAPGGLLLINGDDAALVKAVGKLARRDICIRCYGIQAEQLTYRGTDIRADGKQLVFDMVCDGAALRLSYQTPSEEQIYHILAAAALGLNLGVPPERVEPGLWRCDNKKIRPFVFSYCGLTVMADCDCESAVSMQFALKSFARLTVRGKRIAVLGGGQALSGEPKASHVLGQAAADAAIDHIICYGDDGNLLKDAILAAGGRQRIDCVADRETLEAQLMGLLQPMDALLLEGGTETQLHTVLRRLFGITDGRI